MEVQRFLDEDELVPVIFKRECPMLGFIVDPGMNGSTIPVNFSTNLPIWLARKLAEDKVVSVGLPGWVQEMQPGSVVNPHASITLASEIRELSAQEGGQPDFESPVAQMSRDRVHDVVGESFRLGQGRMCFSEERVLYREEQTVVDAARETYRNFLRLGSEE